MKISVFDSGIGGKAIADVIRVNFPNALINEVNDRDNLPYGDKTTTEIIKYTKTAIKPLINNCDVLVVACNTATSAAISNLRSSYPKQKFVGLEPMVKPAAFLTKTNKIAVCATPVTLKSNSYKSLKKQHAKDIDIFEPDCGNWAVLIEHGNSDKIDLESFSKYIKDNDIDVVVLGCTHYIWIKDELTKKLGDKVKVIEPSQAIISRIKELI
jgi:glutamate racemase